MYPLFFVQKIIDKKSKIWYDDRKGKGGWKVMLNKVIESMRNKTYSEMLEVLNDNGICSVIRPTAFGKTVMLVNYARTHKNKKCIIIEPWASKIRELQEQNADLDNVEYLTYHSCRLDRFENLKDKISKDTVFMFDEAHNIGSEIIKTVWQDFIDRCKLAGALVIGTTASELRTDGVDVTNDLFRGIGVSEYTLDMAIEDGALTKPSYYTGVILDESLISTLETKYKGSVNNKQIMEVKRVSNVGRNIRQVVDEEGLGNQKYYQFLIFYKRINQINDEIDNLRLQLEKEFNGYTINMVPVTSEHTGCDKVLLGLKPRDNTVDVIMSVDMLRECFHLPNLTGAVMLRSTHSWVVYEQQVGRIITDNLDRKMFLLDLVGNNEADFRVNPVYSGPPKIGIQSLRYVDFKMTAEQANAIEELKKVQLRVRNYCDKYENIKTNIRCIASIYKAQHKTDVMAIAKDWGFSLKDVYVTLNDAKVLRESDRLENIPSMYKDMYTDIYTCWGTYMRDKAYS